MAVSKRGGQRMTILGYLTEHWGMLIMLIGLAFLLYTDMHLERRMVRRMIIVIVMLFVYSVLCYIEIYLGNQTEPSGWRPILCVLNYSLVTFALVNMIMIVYPEQRIYLYVPAVLNAILCLISIPTGLVFYIDQYNHFHRGPLGYLTYIVNALYLVYFIINLFKGTKARREDYPVLIFLATTAVLCLTMPLFMENVASHWFNITITIDLTLYYVYLLQSFTKRDPLTKLLNRQSYYSDAEKHMNEITAFVAIDMDGLKEVNDTHGHTAGDIALKTLADCFWRAAQRKQRIYRIGGDEYVILCVNSSEQDVKVLIERIKAEVAKTSYTCSIGYAMKGKDSTIDTLYQLADANLYEEKKLFYERSGKKGRRR